MTQRTQNHFGEKCVVVFGLVGGAYVLASGVWVMYFAVQDLLLMMGAFMAFTGVMCAFSSLPQSWDERMDEWLKENRVCNASHWFEHVITAVLLLIFSAATVFYGFWMILAHQEVVLSVLHGIVCAIVGLVVVQQPIWYFLPVGVKNLLSRSEQISARF